MWEGGREEEGEAREKVKGERGGKEKEGEGREWREGVEGGKRERKREKGERKWREGGYGEGRGVEGWGVGEGRNTAVSKILHLPESEKLNTAHTCVNLKDER